MTASRLIAYADSWTGFAPIAASQYDTVILSFLLPDPTSGLPAAVPWDMLTNAGQNDGIATLTNAGKTVLLSVGGATLSQAQMAPLFTGDNLSVFTGTVGRIVAGGPITLGGTTYDFGPGLDGVDFDLENFASYTGGPETTTWAANLAALTTAVRKAIGPDKLITHAPQTPYLLSNWSSTQAGINSQALYTQMMDLAGDDVDWLNVQFYSNGEVNSAITLAGYRALNAKWPGKIALGKPLASTTPGYLAPAVLCEEVVTPLTDDASGPLCGVMVWEYVLDTNVTPTWSEQIKAALA